MKKGSFFQEYRLRSAGGSKVPVAVVDPLIEQVMSSPEDQLLSVGAEKKVTVERNGEEFSTAACDACGEMVVEKYLRVLGEKRVCLPCQEKAL